MYKVYMSKVKEAVLAIFFTLFALSTFAQTGSVRGRIIDAKTKKPLEFVNVSIRATGTQTPLTGTVSDSTGVFRGMPNPIEVVRYHSLAVAENTLPKCLRVTARAEDGEVMGIRHTDFLVEGVQFHPESIMTFGGKRMLENFLLEAKAL